MKISYLVALLCCSLVTFSVTAQERQPIGNTGSQPLGMGIWYLEDKSGNLNLEQVQAQEDGWLRNEAEVFNRGYNTSAWWFRITLQNVSQLEDWLLVIDYPLLDYVDVHVIQQHASIQHYTMGDHVPFYRRPEKNRYFIVPLHIPRVSSLQLLIRVQTSGSVDVPMTLWNRAEFTAHESIKQTTSGLYFGALLIIAAYNFLLYLVLGERPYLYYVGFVVSMVLFVATLDGWTFQLFWPNSTGLNDHLNLVFVSLIYIFGLLFTRNFLSIPTLSTWLDRGLVSMIVIAIILVLCSVWIQYGVLIRILAPLAVTSCLYSLFCGIVSLARGQLAARYYTVAWIALLVGGISLALANIGLLPVNFFTKNAAQIGSIIEVLLLSFALAERINQERALRMAAQQQALTLQIDHNTELEQRVQERTQALEEALKKLEELSNTDQLTQLKNRRFLDSYLDLEVQHAAKHGRPLALLLLDVDHFKSVNDTHGHLAGDDCLKQVATRILLQVSRPSDLVARFGGEEFCVILPDTNTANALIVAERIRTAIESTSVETRVGAMPITISVGISVISPEHGLDISTALEKADLALYESKENGRNRSTVAR